MVNSHLLTFDDEVKPLGDLMTAATLDVYNRCASELLPTPDKPHYLFNLRDIAKVSTLTLTLTLALPLTLTPTLSLTPTVPLTLTLSLTPTLTLTLTLTLPGLPGRPPGAEGLLRQPRRHAPPMGAWPSTLTVTLTPNPHPVAPPYWPTVLPVLPNAQCPMPNAPPYCPALLPRPIASPY